MTLSDPHCDRALRFSSSLPRKQCCAWQLRHRSGSIEAAAGFHHIAAGGVEWERTTGCGAFTNGAFYEHASRAESAAVVTLLPIVFLDIDGVLTTLATKYRTGDPACVARLNRITDATGAAIVVSSTWRGDPDIAGILAGWGVTGKVVGITPTLSRRNESGLYVGVKRGHEIMKWLGDNSAGTARRRIAILDDESDMDMLIEWLVRTDTHLGLRDEDVDAAIALLGDAQATEAGRAG